MLHFKNYYSQKQFEKFLDTINPLKEDESKKELRKEKLKKCQLEFSIAVVKFLQDNIKNKNIIPVLISKHHVRNISIWNKIFNLENISLSERDYEISIIGYLIHTLRYLGEKFTFEYLCDYIDKGDINRFDLPIMSNCQKCDEFYELEFKNWIPILTNDKGKSLECFNGSNKSIEFTIKTSEILIADWFRIEEFTTKVDYDDLNNPSICTQKGRELSTLNSIKHGFISVHVGNSCPTVFIKNNGLYCGEINDEEECLNKYILGNVCTDLWNVTIIEKQHLINLLSQDFGLDVAKLKVEEYLQNNDDNIIRCHLETGKYNLCFNGNHRDFQNNSNEKIENVKLFFSLNKI